MSLCINPQCQKPDNSDTLLRCQSCGSELLLEGRYRVLCLLGEGGFAKTYEASDRTSIPKVLKVLSKNQPKPVEQFQREAQVLTRLNHPGIPQGEEYFTFFPQNNQEPVHCLVMEKIEGENLYDWLKNRGDRPITERLAVDWLTQLANTLHEVHQQQLFHRDIKPSNIMLKPDGQLVLIDFGIAREITETYEQQKAAGQVTRVVSDGYSPLEQVIGRAVPQSDFFALGRAFVHLLTGIHPLDLCDPYRHDIYTDELENWRDKAPQISPLLGDFIDQLMARPIQGRPRDTQTILERLSDIKEILYPAKQSKTKLSSSQSSSNWQNISLAYTLGGWVSGHSDGVWSVAISPNGEILASGSNDKTIKLWELKTGQEIQTLTDHSGSVRAVAISLNGETLVSGSADSTIKIWNLKTGEIVHTLTGHKGCVCSVAISSDGQTLASGGQDTTIKVWNLSTGQEIRTYTGHSDIVLSVAICARKQILFSASLDGTVKLWPGGNNCITQARRNVISCVAVSIDNQLLASGSHSRWAPGEGDIQFFNLNIGKVRRLSGYLGDVRAIAISPDSRTLINGTSDGKIKILDLKSDQVICTLSEHLDVVISLAISSDGKTLASGSFDGTIKVWRIQ